ncbi:MAG: copper resistance protein CopC, partial [Acidimicrobiia bacterium]
AEPEPDAEAAARLRRSVVVEVVLALAVLGVTAVLVQTVPGREAVAGGPFSTTVTGDGLLVEVTVDPAGVGANRLHVYSYDEDGLTAKPIPELTAEIAQPARDLGPLPVELELIYPGHWVSNGMQIPIRGTWELELTARLTEFDQIEVATAFEVDR